MTIIMRLKTQKMRGHEYHDDDCMMTISRFAMQEMRGHDYHHDYW